MLIRLTAFFVSLCFLGRAWPGASTKISSDPSTLEELFPDAVKRAAPPTTEFVDSNNDYAAPLIAEISYHGETHGLSASALVAVKSQRRRQDSYSSSGRRLHRN